MRAALYARFSSDLQNPRSIEDQLALCRAYCERERLDVRATFEDRAMSGASLIGRDGMARLMDAARASAIDVVVVEALDRISRDQEDMAGIYKRLKFLGVEIRCVHDGKADEIQIGVRSLVGALYLTDLGNRVRRAALGRVREGKLPGGLSYGYRAQAGLPGNRTIDEGEAAIVRRIFAAYLDGDSPREIAKCLNAEGVPPPRRGATWNASTITGSRQRGNGILHNVLFKGELVWNRLRMVKDPDTGRRISRLNDAAAVARKTVPELAIVDVATFDAVQAETARRAHRFTAERKPRPRYAFSGLMRCGVCGGGYVRGSVDRRGHMRLACSSRRESGSCSNKAMYRADMVEAQALEGLARELRDPRLIEEFVAAYEAERKRLAGDRGRERAVAETRLGEVRRAIARLVDALADGTLTAGAVGAKLRALEAEQTELVAAIERLGLSMGKVITLHPAAVQLYLRHVEDLAATLNETSRAQWVRSGSAADKLREVVDMVIVHPTPRGEAPRIEIRGKLAALMQVPASSRGCDRGGSSGRI